MGDETFCWGESSVGTIVVSSDSPIVLEDISVFTAKECFQKAFVVAALIENDRFAAIHDGRHDAMMACIMVVPTVERSITLVEWWKMR